MVFVLVNNILCMSTLIPFIIYIKNISYTNYITLILTDHRTTFECLSERFSHKFIRNSGVNVFHITYIISKEAGWNQEAVCSSSYFLDSAEVGLGFLSHAFRFRSRQSRLNFMNYIPYHLIARISKNNIGR